MNDSEHDVPVQNLRVSLAYTGFPDQHRAKLHSTNPRGA